MLQGTGPTTVSRGIADFVYVSEAASKVATDAGVRAALVERQRQLMQAGDWVAEGRDIGTVVAPHAELKVFLTADPEERAGALALRARERATMLATVAGSGTVDHSPCSNVPPRPSSPRRT